MIVKGNKLLLTRSKGKSVFYWPGGKYEPADNKDPGACLRRELKEELGVELKSFKHYRTYSFNTGDYADRNLLLELYFVEFTGEPKPCSEIEELCWFSAEDFIKRIKELPSSYITVVPDLIEDKII